MAEIINLRLVRKAKARAEKEKLAATNRARFGRSKAERALETARSEQAKDRLDAHRKDDPPDRDG